MTDGTQRPNKADDLFPAEEEQPSPAADQLIAEFKALGDQVTQKYGNVGELPFEEWVVWKSLMARISELSLPEQRYVWRYLGLPGLHRG